MSLRYNNNIEFIYLYHLFKGNYLANVFFIKQVKFSNDGSQLFTVCRVSNVISCWDIRNSTDVLYDLPRPGQTSQRIAFDIDPSGKVLTTGDQVKK